MKTQVEQAKENMALYEQTQESLSDKYLQSDGNSCPYCDSDSITAGHGEFDCDYGWRDVLCNDCQRTWIEHFTLTGITAEDADVEEILKQLEADRQIRLWRRVIKTAQMIGNKKEEQHAQGQVALWAYKFFERE